MSPPSPPPPQPQQCLSTTQLHPVTLAFHPQEFHSFCNKTQTSRHSILNPSPSDATLIFTASPSGSFPLRASYSSHTELPLALQMQPAPPLAWSPSFIKQAPPPRMPSRCPLHSRDVLPRHQFSTPLSLRDGELFEGRGYILVLF